MATVQTVEELIRARYPLVYMVSYEEPRLCQELCLLAQRRERLYHVWTCTDGLATPKKVNEFDLSNPETYTLNDGLSDPFAILDHILGYKEDSIFVLRDYHPFLEDPAVIRRLRDLARQLKRGKHVKNVIILSPIRELPPELELDVMTADIDLPRLEELVQQVHAAFEDIPPRVKAKFTGQDKDSQIRRIAEAGMGLTRLEFDNVLALSLIRTRTFDVDVINDEKETIIRRNGILQFYRPKVNMDSVGGLASLKDWLKKRRNSFGDKARKYGIPNPKGVLIVGIPGTGKSLTAKVVGSSWKMPLLRLDMANVFAGIVGESERNMRQVIKTAEAVAPCVLWLDELEKGLAGAGGGGENDSGVTQRVFGTFLTWLSEKETPVFVVATANNVAGLPPELLRKGRFDEIFFCDLPDRPAREEIIKIHINRTRRDPDDQARDISNFDIGLLGKKSDGYSGSEIEEAVKSAMVDAFDQDMRDFTTDDIARNLDPEIIPPLSKTMAERIEALRTWAANRARRADAEVRTDKDVRRSRFADLD